MRSQINQQHLDGGGGERARTDDLLRARQALSQLSYTPNKQHAQAAHTSWLDT